MKKYLKIIVPGLVFILLISVGIFFFNEKNSLVEESDYLKDVKSAQCAGEGENISSCVGCKTECCPGLRVLNKSIVNGECQLFVPMGSPGLTCSNCGNGVCDTQKTEDNCNCPEDCK